MKNEADSILSGFVAVTRVYEVECSSCGVVAANGDRQQADAEARRHYLSVHDGRGYLVGKSYGTSVKTGVWP